MIGIEGYRSHPFFMGIFAINVEICGNVGLAFDGWFSAGRHTVHIRPANMQSGLQKIQVVITPCFCLNGGLVAGELRACWKNGKVRELFPLLHRLISEKQNKGGVTL